MFNCFCYFVINIKFGCILIDALHFPEVLSNPINPTEPEGLKKVKTAYKACMNPTLKQHQYIDSPELALADRYGGLPLLNPDEPTTPLTWAEIGELTRTFGVHHFFQFIVRNFDPVEFILVVIVLGIMVYTLS